MPKTEFDGLPVIETDESEEITVAVKPEDIEEGDPKDPGQHAISYRTAQATRRGRCACIETRGTDTARKAMVPIRCAKASFLGVCV